MEVDLLFSYRNRYKKIKDKLQIESIDDETRNGIWNNLYNYYWSKMQMPPCYTGRTSNTFLNSNPLHAILIKQLWMNYFKHPIDELEDDLYYVQDFLKKSFFDFKWYEIYDFIEFVVHNFVDNNVNTSFKDACNQLFQKEAVGYRFVDNFVTKITSEEEIDTIEEALNSPLDAVKEHINRSLELLSDRENPDYRNSIKESISAVESICKILSKKRKATLTDALNKLDKKIPIHPAFKSGLEKLYGYTSDEQGVRHSLMDKSNIDFEDAKFILVASSAFVNFLLSKAVKAKIKIEK